ncbi:alpha/beta hydrolase family protein [Silvimonas amylolytica]|uniref:Alpha/beta hydrolase family protein n=1 Tax=Silvimonas amylolytica TaxID=449663 RepID=A0ABQ2PK82_9NEIS|nr:alpha/beta hydrolase [Silvimonas amylolytica]GGP25644.1 hypothetical protein GCM10010971_14630 [Silvimonas amylolytica]
MAAPCTNEDYLHAVTGNDQCVVIASFGATDAPQVMLVWLHGDVSSGGPAVYHFAQAEAAATRFAPQKVLSVAMIRPGYADDKGNQSGGSNNGRMDHYTKVNMQIVGGAIDRLKQHYHPQRVILIGHSGGAATAANLAGMMPGLADADVLVSCPCDLVAWRLGRHQWSASENPIRWADQVKPSVKIVALTGSADDNTGQGLARDYVATLKQHGVDAQFLSVDNANHNGAFRSPMVLDTVATLLGTP